MKHKQEKLEWLNNPHTIDLIEAIKINMDAIKDSWSTGAYTGSQTSETIQLNAQAIGQFNSLVHILEFITDINYNQEEVIDSNDNIIH